MTAQRDFKEYVRNELTHSPTNSKEQEQAHITVSQLFVEFGEALADVVPDGPDGTKMVNYLTIARAWAQKSVAQNFQGTEDESDLSKILQNADNHRQSTKAN